MNKRLLLACAFVVAVTLPLFIYFNIKNGKDDKQKENSLQEEVSEIVENVSTNNYSDFNLISKNFELNLVAKDDNNVRQDVSLENNIFSITFDTKGASVSSIILREYTDKDKKLDLLIKTSPESRAFMLYKGRDFTKPISDIFAIENRGDNFITFRKDFKLNGKDLILRKTYTISNQYMIKLSVGLETSSDINLADEMPCLYSVEFAPFLGPSLDEGLKASANDRKYFIKLTNSKKKRGINFSGNTKNVFLYSDSFDWFEWTGKYFSFIVIPQVKQNNNLSIFKFSNTNNSIYLTKNLDVLDSSYSSGKRVNNDIYFYLGPQLKDKLQAFDYSQDNDFGLSNLSLSKALEGGGALPHLQNLLKIIMKIFYRWIPNWGLAIIFLTILVKLLLYPLNAKSAKSAAAMQKVAPKLDEIRMQYKDNPQAQNQAILALYKKHKISPMSSLLPMLIQLPILLAVYGLLNKHFELRGAMFIPGWIEDLSLPETVYIMPFGIPFLGSQIHILPIIYVVSMIFSMVWTQKQNTAGQAKGMQRFMTYGLPTILFFSLYNVSSGLLVYWTIMNFLSIVQQIYENGKLKKHDRDIIAESESTGFDNFGNKKILPPKVKKNKKR